MRRRDPVQAAFLAGAAHDLPACRNMPCTSASNTVREMRYLWRTPLRMDNARLRAVLGREPHTPLDDAIDAALQDLGVVAAARSPTRTPAPSVR
jgi:nucleoside-diphosphate-sugar epimerase